MVTRSEFMSALLGGATAIKEVAATEKDGSPPSGKRLLAIETDAILSRHTVESMQEALKPFAERYGVEFMILHSGVRLVDPQLPRTKE